jgi:hypothetical protein
VKKFFLLAGVIVGLAGAINAGIDATRECGCQPECWCKQPVLRHFRWVLPFGHKAVAPDWKQQLESDSLD